MKIKYIPLTIVKILHIKEKKKKTSSTTIYTLYSIKVIEFDFAPIIFFFILIQKGNKNHTKRYHMRVHN
jgi:hypothetical protein